MEKTKEQEVQILNNYYNNGKNQILIVYGHIKTGSINVLTAFAEGKNYSYYCACSAAERLQQYIWGQDLQRKGAVLPEYPSFTDIFEEYERQAINANAPYIIFIENFENIMKASTTFLNDVYEVLNKKDHPQMMVVLLGSNAAWIENNMVEKLGSDASNIAGFLKIKPYSFQEMHKKFLETPYADAISTYSVFGGKAQLWEYFDPKKSFKENVCERFLDVKNSVLIHMTPAMLEENLRETAVYNTILFGLADGKNKLNDIHHATGFSRAKIMVYLKSLIDLGIVEKVYSFATTGHENVQKGVYRISDCLTHFYFRFLYQHYSELVRLKPEDYYEKYIAGSIGEYVLNAYKLVCKEYILKSSEYGKLPFVVDEEGEWVGKMGSIDIVAQSETGDTLVGLCSWDEKIDVKKLDFLRNCCKKARLNADYYYMFSAVGFDEGLIELSKKLPELKLISLDDLRADRPDLH